MRDGRAEARETEAYLKQYVEVTRGEPARLAAETSSQVRRPRACEVERYLIDVARE